MNTCARHGYCFHQWGAYITIMTTLYFFNEPVKKLPATLKKKRKVAKGHRTTTPKHKQEVYNAKKGKNTSKHCLFMCMYFLYNNQIITSKNTARYPTSKFWWKVSVKESLHVKEVQTKS